MSDIPAYRRPYVRHLPEDFVDSDNEHPDLVVSGETAFSNSIFNDHPSGALVSLFVQSDIEKFEKTGNPVYAIRAWNACIGNGLYPPLCVLKWLDKALKAYSEADGKDDIVKLLGLNGRRGKPPLLTAHKQSCEEESIANWVHWLVEGCKVTIGDAALMVCAREEARGNKKRNESWIAENYSKKWRKKLMQEELPDFDESLWRSFIESFPEYSRPRGLK